MKRIALVMAALGLAACGGEDCEHEIDTREGISLCMPEDRNMALCVVEPKGCYDCGAGRSVIAYYVHGEDGPEVWECGCTKSKEFLKQCNKPLPMDKLPQ